ncbi:MAG: ATP-binding protein, partial [Alphaproteobacteria bacterium]
MESDLATARDDAESASRSKAAFLAAMSHEIRTPMNGIVGMADLLSQTSLADSQRRSLRTIRESAYALLRIINDILDFSKIEAGRLEIEDAEISLAEVVESAVAPLAIAATTSRLRLLTYVDPALPRNVRGDPVRIRQILMNICGNAVKFSKNGEVVVRADADPSRPGWIRFSVIDHGIGISEENQKKLFQEFSQAESSTTRRFGGTGLGLAICKRLTEMMGGEIAVNSVLGLGTKFIVSLPLPSTSSVSPPENNCDFAGHSILLAGRSSEERAFCRSYLEFWRANVQEVAQLDSLIEQVKTSAIVKGTVPLVVFCSDLYPSEVHGAVTWLGDVASDIRCVIIRDPSADGVQLLRADNIIEVDAQPMRRAVFINGVAIALGLASPEVLTPEEAVIMIAREAPSVPEAERRRELILVAEDNATNREVIEGQLTRLGYASVLTANGQEAFDSWRSGRFAILLTDCHMPVMDGFELTRLVREYEAAKGLPRTPIISITANAMKGEA